MYVSSIKVMDEVLANKIAAGEVVEKTMNVVKELVENSIDAKSSEIEIRLIDSGVKEIEVKDNGIGMDEEDAKMAFMRHATSKLKNLDDLLREAVSMGGSDLHLSVGAQPRTRVHGNLKNMNYAVITPQVASNLLMPLMDTLARSTLNTCGQYDLAYSIKDVSRFRVNIFKQKGDLAGVFRVLNETVPDYTKLGLPINVFNMYKKRRGLILVVGPTGSGKSTTLASFLDIINKNLYKHIITLEEPIEYLHWHSRSLINQREIGVDCDSFANGLRAALREDPDVILIGEMRDLETTEIALQSAETGHLVCSTLHTLGAADTINRIIDITLVISCFVVGFVMVAGAGAKSKKSWAIKKSPFEMCPRMFMISLK